jgi:ATP adenylyltransferase
MTAPPIPPGMIQSPFHVTDNILARTRHAFAYVNQFPVTPGHVLILPKRKIVSLFDLNRDEIVAHMNLARRVVAKLDEYYKPAGYIMGWNDGVAGGQSVAHAHLHILPCYRDDTARPVDGRRGGGLRMRHVRDTLDPFYNKPAGAVESIDFLDVADVVGPVRVLRPRVPIAPGHMIFFHRDMVTRDSRPYHRPKEVVEVFDALHDWRDKQRAHMKNPPDGYNVVWNMGLAAGQIYNANVMEIVSRFTGDTPSPRGGITTFFQNLPAYYDTKNAGTDVPVTQKTKLLFPKV